MRRAIAFKTVAVATIVILIFIMNVLVAGAYAVGAISLVSRRGSLPAMPETSMG